MCNVTQTKPIGFSPMKTLLLKKTTTTQHVGNFESMSGRFLRRKTLPALHLRFVPQHAGK